MESGTRSFFLLFSLLLLAVAGILAADSMHAAGIWPAGPLAAFLVIVPAGLAYAVGRFDGFDSGAEDVSSLADQLEAADGRAGLAQQRVDQLARQLDAARASARDRLEAVVLELSVANAEADFWRQHAEDLQQLSDSRTAALGALLDPKPRQRRPVGHPSPVAEVAS